MTTGDPSVTVAIIDTGIWANHEDLQVSLGSGISFIPVQNAPPPPACYTTCPPPGSCPIPCDSSLLNITLPCDYVTSAQPQDDQSHGTAVAGIVAGIGNNSKGVAGIAWGAKLISVKILDCNGFSSACFSARALDTCRTRQIPIVNMSYAGTQEDPAERIAAKNAFHAGMFLAAGIGNNNASIALYPARYKNTVCAVGAFFGNGRRWAEGEGRGSVWGHWIDFSAPGGNLIVTTHWGCRLSNNKYYDLQGCGHPNDGIDFGGTSAATPVVSGIAALLKSKYPMLLGEDIHQALMFTARHPDTTIGGSEVAFDDSAGFGHVRADTALRLFAAPKVISPRRVFPVNTVAVDTALRRLKNLNIPNYSNDSNYTVVRYKMRMPFSFDTAYASTPMIWPRSSGSLGVKDTMVFDWNEEVYWAKVDSVSATGCRLETNTFKIIGVPAPYDRVPAGKAAVAFTSVGVQAGSFASEDGEGNGSESGRTTGFRVFQNDPNPMVTATSIRFEVPRRTPVRLEVFDLQGRRVRTIVHGDYAAGTHAATWNRRSDSGRLVEPGVYLYRFRAGAFRDQKKLVVVQ
jgi:subtilisin family serine protease